MAFGYKRKLIVITKINKYLKMLNNTITAKISQLYGYGSYCASRLHSENSINRITYRCFVMLFLLYVIFKIEVIIPIPNTYVESENVW